MKLYHDIVNDRYRAAKDKLDALHYFAVRAEEDKPYSWYSPPCIDDIQERPTPFNPRKLIATADAFEDYCEFLLGNLLGGLSVETHPHYVRPVREDDYVDDDYTSFIYTWDGMGLYDRACRRLSRLAEKYWPGEEIELRSHYYREI